jgi:hypothetical protein
LLFRWRNWIFDSAQRRSADILEIPGPAVFQFPNNFEPGGAAGYTPGGPFHFGKTHAPKPPAIWIAQDEGEIEISEVTEGGGISLAVNKVTWAQVGRVTEPGRYMFKFGWLTITADDLAVWQQFPSAAFTLYSAAAKTQSNDEIEEEVGEEFRLGIFELGASDCSESEK